MTCFLVKDKYSIAKKEDDFNIKTNNINIDSSLNVIAITTLLELSLYCFYTFSNSVVWNPVESLWKSIQLISPNNFGWWPAQTNGF